MKSYFILVFLWCPSCFILFAQGASFGPFEGTVYDLEDYDLVKGYTPGVQKFDVLGKIQLASLSVKNSFQGASYFPGVHVHDIATVGEPAEPLAAKRRKYCANSNAYPPQRTLLKGRCILGLRLFPV